MKQIYLEKKTIRIYQSIVDHLILKALKKGEDFIFNIFLIQNFRKGPPGSMGWPVAFNMMPRVTQSPYCIKYCNCQLVVNQSSINIYFTQS